MPQVPLPNMARQVGMPNAQPLSGARAPMSTMLLQQSQQAAQTMSAVGDSMVRIGAKIRSERDYISAKTDHLKISDYIIQQQIEHSKLSPSDQLGQSEAYRGKVKSFIDDTITGASTDQSRNMLKGPAQQSLLGFKQWSLTRELKAQQAQEAAVVVASGDNAAVAASVAAAQPEGDPLALAAADEMPSDDPNIDTGPPILEQHAANAKASQDPKKPPRTNFEVQRDTAFSDYEDEADLKIGESGPPEVREAFIRDKKSGFYDKVVSTLLAQDPPMIKRAKKLMESIPATEINPKMKGALMGKIKQLGLVQRGREDNDKALHLAFKALDKAGVGDFGPPGSSGYLASQQIARAKNDLERQARSGAITASVYSTALRHLDVEGADVAAKQRQEAGDLVQNVMDTVPSATSMAELPPGLSAAIQNNPQALAMMESRAEVSNGRKVSGALAASGLFARNRQVANQAEADAAKDLLDDFTMGVEQHVLTHYEAIKSDYRKIWEVPGVSKKDSPKDIEKKLTEFFFAGEAGNKGMIQKVLTQYKATTLLNQPGSDEWTAAVAMAAQDILGPTMTDDKTVNVFGGVKTKDDGTVVRTARVSPSMLDAVNRHLTEMHNNNPSSPGMNAGTMASELRRNLKSTDFFFDLNKNGELDDGDIPIPAYALRVNQNLNKAQIGRIAIQVDGELVPVGRFGEGFVKRIQGELTYELAEADKGGASRDVVTYKYIQQLVDETEASVIDFSQRQYGDAEDGANLLRDARDSRSMIHNARNIVLMNSEDWDRRVVDALAPSKGQRIDGFMLDNAREILRKRSGVSKEELKELLPQLGRYASAVTYEAAKNDPMIMGKMSVPLWQAAKALKARVEGPPTGKAVDLYDRSGFLKIGETFEGASLVPEIDKENLSILMDQLKKNHSRIASMRTLNMGRLGDTKGAGSSPRNTFEEWLESLGGK